MVIKRRVKIMMDISSKQLGFGGCESKILFLAEHPTSIPWHSLSQGYRTFYFKRLNVPLTKKVFSGAVS